DCFLSLIGRGYRKVIAGLVVTQVLHMGFDGDYRRCATIAGYLQPGDRPEEGEHDQDADGERRPFGGRSLLAADGFASRIVRVRSLFASGCLISSRFCHVTTSLPAAPPIVVGTPRTMVCVTIEWNGSANEIMLKR